MTEVKETTNHSMFKISDANRLLKERSIETLIKSIKLRNLLYKRPIMVTEDLTVIDGQHRLEAAKRLKLPIYYTVDIDVADDDMPLLNSAQKSWSYEDFLRFYVSKGKEEYIKFHEFMKDSQLAITQVFSLIGIRGRDFYDNFKAGEFKFPEGEQLEIVHSRMRDIEAVKSLVRKKKMCACAYLEMALFNRAMTDFLDFPGVDLKEFLNKIPTRIDIFDRRNSKIDYLRMFMNIYNYRRKEPIEVITRT